MKVYRMEITLYEDEILPEPRIGEDKKEPILICESILERCDVEHPVHGGKILSHAAERAAISIWERLVKGR